MKKDCLLGRLRKIGSGDGDLEMRFRAAQSAIQDERPRFTGIEAGQIQWNWLMGQLATDLALERNRLAMLLAYMRWSSLIVLIPFLVVSEALMWGYCLLRGSSDGAAPPSLAGRQLRQGSSGDSWQAPPVSVSLVVLGDHLRGPRAAGHSRA